MLDPTPTRMPLLVLSPGSRVPSQRGVAAGVVVVVVIVGAVVVMVDVAAAAVVALQVKIKVATLCAFDASCVGTFRIRATSPFASAPPVLHTVITMRACVHMVLVVPFATL